MFYLTNKNWSETVVILLIKVENEKQFFGQQNR